ncbi:MAG: DUF4231 domain-containing protein [Candidatus Dormibacteria bacterium]
MTEHSASNTSPANDPALVAGGLADSELPEIFRATDGASLAAQNRFIRATSAQLAILVLAAISGATHLSVGSPPIDLGPLCAGILFLAAVLVETFVLRGQSDKIWYEGRAAAESAKTLAWRYAVGGEPFRVDTPEQEQADTMLLDSLEGILNDLNEFPLAASIEHAEQITDAMRSLRQQPLEVRKHSYREFRIDEQRRWYATKAQFNIRRARQWSNLQIILEMAGAVGALVKAVGLLPVSYLYLAAPLAVAVASWTQAKQYKTLANAYGIASQELSTIHSRVGAQHTESEWASFVETSEGAISREHTLWRASRGGIRPQRR